MMLHIPDVQGFKDTMCEVMKTVSDPILSSNESLLASAAHPMSLCNVFVQQFCDVLAVDMWVEHVGASHKTAAALESAVEESFDSTLRPLISFLGTVGSAPTVPALGSLDFMSTFVFPTPMSAITAKVTFEGIDADFLKREHDSDDGNLCQLSTVIVSESFKLRTLLLTTAMTSGAMDPKRPREKSW